MSVMLVVVAAAALSHGTSPRTGATLTPLQAAGQLCSSETSSDTIRRVLFVPHPDTIDPGNDPELKRIMSGITLRLIDVTVEDLNPDIEKVSCAATGRAEFAPVDRLPTTGEGFSLRLSYTIQPSASGDGQIVKVENGERIIEEINAFVASVNFHRQHPNSP